MSKPWHFLHNVYKNETLYIHIKYRSVRMWAHVRLCVLEMLTKFACFFPWKIKNWYLSMCVDVICVCVWVWCMCITVHTKACECALQNTMFLLFRVPGTSSYTEERCLVRFMSVNLVKWHRNKTEPSREHSVRSTISGTVIPRWLKALNKRPHFSSTHTMKVTGNCQVKILWIQADIPATYMKTKKTW